jgi:16S rRNA U516 pseudouridylate synthase RsuA-like enzyme
MKATDYTKMQARYSQLRLELAQIQAQMEQFRLEQLRKVEMVKNASSTSLLFKGRTINAKKNRWGRLVIKEGKKTLVKEYFGGIHDVRFAVAMGQL